MTWTLATKLLRGALVVLFVALLAASLFLSRLCNQDQQAHHGHRETDSDQGASDEIPILLRAIEPVAGFKEQHYPDPKQDGTYGEPICKLFEGTTATDRVIAVSTLAYLLVTFWMLRAIRRQADIAEGAITK